MKTWILAVVALVAIAGSAIASEKDRCRTVYNGSGGQGESTYNKNAKNVRH